MSLLFKVGFTCFTILSVSLKICSSVKSIDLLANLTKISYSKADIEVQWTRELFLHGNFEIKWFSNDSTWLIMEMSGETEGYVAVGFSPNGGMQGSDIVIGWIDSKGLPHLKDTYAVGNATPIEDTESNYELILAHQLHGRTTIRFRRKWETCDTKHDFDITDATMRLIYAWNDQDPLLTREILLPKYHGPSSRGTQSVYLKSKAANAKFPDEVISPNPFTKSWDLRIGNITVDSQETLYYCKIVKAPQLDKIGRIVGFRPFVETRHKAWIHRMTVHECNIPEHLEEILEYFDKFINVPGKLCYSKPFPQEWIRYCTSSPVVWSTGAEGMMLPEQNGFPIKNKPNVYYILEIHYVNPQRLNMVRENSGFRIFLTDEPKFHDTGMMSIGNTISPFHMIPPGATKFTTVGYCASECTKQTFPPEGITITHAMLNGNYALRKISLRHIRKGVELPPVIQDTRYNFLYKQFRVVEPVRKVLPGDILMAECEYNTSWKEDPTFGGLKDTDETCHIFIYYYPKVNLSECRMQLQLNSFINAVGIRQVTGEILQQMEFPYIIDDGLSNNTYKLIGEMANSSNVFDRIQIVEPSPVDSNGLTMDLYLRSLDWWGHKEKLVKHVEEKWLKAKRYPVCIGPSKNNMHLKERVVTYPKFIKYRSNSPRKCSSRIFNNSASKITINRQYPRVRNYGYLH